MLRLAISLLFGCLISIYERLLDQVSQLDNVVSCVFALEIEFDIAYLLRFLGKQTLKIDKIVVQFFRRFIFAVCAHVSRINTFVTVRLHVSLDAPPKIGALVILVFV